MVQILHPSSTVDYGSWTYTGPGTDQENIDEDVDSADGDTGYASVPNDGGLGTDLIITIDAGIDPQVSTGHIVRFSARRTGITGTSDDFTFSLNTDTDGPITAQPFTATSSYALYEYTLTEAETDSITDYTTISIQLHGEPILGFEMRVSAVEFVIPTAIVPGLRVPPVADVDVGNWTKTGSSTFFGAVQGAVNASDGDLSYVENTDSGYIILGLTPIPDPAVSTGHKLRIFAKRIGASDGGTLSIALKSDGNFVTGLETVTISEEYGIFEYTLSSGEADAITNYSTLEVLVGSPNFVASTFRISAVEFNVEAPLIPSGGNDMRVVRGSMPTSGSTKSFALPSGFGTPKAAIFIVSGGSTDGTVGAVTRSCMSIGWTDGVNQRCWGFGNEGATTGNENGWYLASTGHCIAISNAAGSSRGLATFNSFGVDLVTLNLTAAFPDANLYTVWAISGTGVLAHANHTANIPGGGAALAVTDPAFKPNVLIPIGDRVFSSSIPVWTAGARCCIGFAVDRPSGIQQVCNAWQSVDNVATTDVKTVVGSTCVSGNNTTGGTTPGGKITVNSFDTLGFTVQNVDTPSGNIRIGYLALFIPNAYLWAGILDTPTSTGLASFTAPALGPLGCFVLPNMATSVDAFKTDASAASFGFGVAAGPTTALTVDGYASLYLQDADPVPTNTGAIADSKIGFATENTGGNPTADFASWLPGGVQLNFTAVNASSRKWPALFIGTKTSLPFQKRSSQRALLIR